MCYEARLGSNFSFSCLPGLPCRASLVSASATVAAIHRLSPGPSKGYVSVCTWVLNVHWLNSIYTWLYC